MVIVKLNIFFKYNNWYLIFECVYILFLVGLKVFISLVLKDLKVVIKYDFLKVIIVMLKGKCVFLLNSVGDLKIKVIIDF